ncbi:MAG: hypothetical protein RDV48_07615 [Candidatus Eremiobacteraeota bacterium]|nr:hypothetical protein [Candidatus Eremiobacteraeota bacterium]
MVNGKSGILMALALLFLIAPGASPVYGNPLVVLRPGKAKTEVIVVENPGSPGRLLVTLPTSQAGVTSQSYLGQEQAPRNVGKGKVLLYKIDEKTWKLTAFILNLESGAMTGLKELFPGSHAYMTPEGKVVSTGNSFRVSKDGKFLLCFRVRNMVVAEERYEGEASLVLYDVGARKIVWEKFIMKGDLSLGLRVYGHFTSDLLFVFLNGMLYKMPYRKELKLTPLVKGSLFVTVAPNDSLAVMETRPQGCKLFDFAASAIRSGVKLPDDPVQPVFSPNGEYLCYGERDGALFLVNTLTGKAKVIDQGPVLNPWPLFSPDGTSLVYLKERIARADNYEARGGYRVVCQDLASGLSVTLNPGVSEKEQISSMTGSSQGYWVSVSSLSSMPSSLVRLYCIPWNARGDSECLLWYNGRDSGFVVPDSLEYNNPGL